MKTENKKVLIITYYWPPSGGVGVQRWLHFALNLKKHGWEPIIYTPSNPQFEIKDEGLAELAEGIEVITQPIWEPFHLFHRLTGKKNKDQVKQGIALEKSKKGLLDHLFVWIRGNFFLPDPRVFWVKPSIRFLKTLIQERSISHCVTTGPPHSMHLIGLGLKKQLPALKWAADMRDAWSGWDMLPKLKTSGLALMYHKRLERKVLLSCDLVMTVSKGCEAEFKLKAKTDLDVRIIRNGVPQFEQKEGLVPDKDQFVIGYFGLLNEIRNPEPLWDTISRLCGENEEFSRKLKLRFGGIVSESIKNRLQEDPNLQGKTEFLGYLPHHQIFEEYQRCNVLLLLQNRSDNSQIVLPVKFFEYLSAKSPILCIAPARSELGEIFSSHQVGQVIEEHQTDQIKAFLVATLEDRFPIRLEDYELLCSENSREHQAEELIKLLEAL